MTKVLCDVFKTRKKDEMYLYVAKKDGMSRVPDELLDMFGKPELAMTIIITPDKSLGRADASRVLSDLDEKGFYLQMPPAKEPYMLDLFTKRDSE
ncbi:MAG: YcgL domain-containing protein [Pseudomonadota bacterium]|nr:YcgL domain-containing protein [Pseudomonadota bacterium]